MYLAIIIIISIIIITLFTIWGAHRGFLKMLISFCVLFLALLITKYSVNPVSNFLEKNTSVISSLKEMYADKIPQFNEITTSAGQREAIQKSALPEFLKESLIDNNNSVVYEQLKVNNFADYVSSYIARFMTKVVAFLGVLTLSYLIMRIIVFALKIIHHLPVLHGISTILGGAIGFIIGVIVAFIVMIILCTVFAKTAGMEAISALTNNVFFKWLMDFNIFVDWIK